MRLIDLSQPVLRRQPELPGAPAGASPRSSATTRQHGWRVELLTLVEPHRLARRCPAAQDRRRARASTTSRSSRGAGPAYIADFRGIAAGRADHRRDARGEAAGRRWRTRSCCSRPAGATSGRRPTSGSATRRACRETARRGSCEKRVRGVGIDHYSIGGVRRADERARSTRSCSAPACGWSRSCASRRRCSRCRSRCAYMGLPVNFRGPHRGVLPPGTDRLRMICSVEDDGFL